MKTKTSARRTFIAANQAAFDKAVCAATLRVRQDNRLIGLDKVRRPLAEDAALAAIGYPIGCCVLPGKANTGAIQPILDELFAAAREAALAALK